MNPLPIGATIGILGGGQLGRMLALKAALLGFDVHIYEPEPDCPAGRVSAHCTTAAWDDLDSLSRFASAVDVLTFEFENIPVASVKHLQALKAVSPGVRSLELTQDRFIEKTFINQLGLKTAPFAAISKAEDFAPALASIGTRAILKTNRLGYDGKGQVRISNGTDLATAFVEMGQVDCVLEGFVDFSCEISVVLARASDGAIQAYDITRNVHEAGILRTSTIPSGLSAQLETQAVNAAIQIAEGLSHIGVLAVEFFVTRDETLIVNEIAPRVHNSGHWTLDGCIVCQFEQHIRAAANWPLGNPARHSANIVMQNLIGDDVLEAVSLLSERGAKVHLYGKRKARPGRKMGHVTRV